MIIVAESGATKTDWRLLMDDGTVRNASSAGLNPSVLGPEQINSIIGSVIPELNPEGRSVREIHFYGAGLVNEAAAAPLADVLEMWCPFSDKHFHSDMLAAARALFGDGSGIVAIMGTGSNTCFYDGTQISQTVYSGGFILGDDGSAAVLGKMFISDYLKKLIPEDVAKDFESKYDGSYANIVENVYRSSAPAAYLGSLAPFIMSHYDNPHIKNLVDTNFQNFIDRSLKTYATDVYPVGIVGGFAYACRDIFVPMCEKAGIKVAGIINEPIEGLINYHLSK